MVRRVVFGRGFGSAAFCACLCLLLAIGLASVSFGMDFKSGQKKVGKKKLRGHLRVRSTGSEDGNELQLLVHQVSELSKAVKEQGERFGQRVSSLEKESTGKNYKDNSGIVEKEKGENSSGGWEEFEKRLEFLEQQLVRNTQSTHKVKVKKQVDKEIKTDDNDWFVIDEQSNRELLGVVNEGSDEESGDVGLISGEHKGKSKRGCLACCNKQLCWGSTVRDWALGFAFTILGGAALVWPTDYVVGKIKDSLLPKVKTAAPSHLQQTTGVFNGTVNPKKFQDLKFYFEYQSSTQTKPSVTPLSDVVGNGLVQFQFAGLDANTVYQVTLVVRLSNGQEVRGEPAASVQKADQTKQGAVTFTTSPSPGSLAQLPGQRGCVNSDGSEGCAQGRAVENPEAVVVSAEGKFVYTASSSGGFGVFARGQQTGVLTQLTGQQGCVNSDGSEGCAQVRAVESPQSVVVSTDGQFVYTASFNGGFGVFARDQQTGVLTQLSGQQGCVNASGSEGCAQGRGVQSPQSVVVSADGKFVYTASQSGGFGVFARDQQTGVLTQLSGQQGCVNASGSEGCAQGRGVQGPQSVVVSADGKFVYTASFDGGFGVFARDQQTGVLTQLSGQQGCVNASGSEGCAQGRAVEGPEAVVVSADGKFVYTASYGGGFGVFARDQQTGVLTQLSGQQGCVNASGSEGCAQGRGVEGPQSVVASAEGKFVYTASQSGGFAVFARNQQTGVLTQLSGQSGCVNSGGSEGCAQGRAAQNPLSVVVSADGKFVYTASLYGGFAVFPRDQQTGVLTQLSGQSGCVNSGGSEGCAQARAVENPEVVVVSPDGKFAYTASDGGFGVFARDQQTGVLTQLVGLDGCVNSGGAEGCTQGRAVENPEAVVVSADGKFVYTASYGGGFGVFARDQQTGVLTQLSGQQGCVNASGSEGCAKGRGVENPLSVVVSADGKFAYTASVYGGFGVFARDQQTGVLTQLSGQQGCVNSDGAEGCAQGRSVENPEVIVVSADGKFAYTASVYGGFGVFARDQQTGVLTQLSGQQGCVNSDGAEGCAQGRSVENPEAVVVSADGKFVYMASSSGGFAVFARDQQTGVLTQLAGLDGCVNSGGSEGCAQARAVENPQSVVVSADGQFVYTASFNGGFGVFARDQQTGVLTQLESAAGCVLNGGGIDCASGRSLPAPESMTVSPDGKFLYTVSYDGGFGVFNRSGY